MVIIPILNFINFIDKPLYDLCRVYIAKVRKYIIINNKRFKHFIMNKQSITIYVYYCRRQFKLYYVLQRIMYIVHKIQNLNFGNQVHSRSIRMT